LQRGLRRSDAGTGAPTRIDVHQRVGELAATERIRRRDRIADDPEFTLVGGPDQAFERLRLAFGKLQPVLGLAQRMVGLRGGNHRDRLVQELLQRAAEHAARRAVHPFNAAFADRDDAHQRRIEDRPGAFSLPRRGLMRALAFVRIGVAGDDRAVRARRIDPALVAAKCHTFTVATPQRLFAVPLAMLLKRLRRFDRLVVEGEWIDSEIPQGQAHQFGSTRTQQRGKGVADTLKPAVAQGHDDAGGACQHRHQFELELLDLGGGDTPGLGNIRFHSGGRHCDVRLPTAKLRILFPLQDRAGSRPGLPSHFLLLAHKKLNPEAMRFTLGPGLD
jgi:hypothetical protein